MNIGVDIDGVLNDEDDYIIEHMGEYLFKNNIEVEFNPTGYEDAKYKDSKQLYYDVYKQNLLWDFTENGRVRHGAREIIKRLREEGHKIYIITSRHFCIEEGQDGLRMRKTIKEWLKKNNIEYDGLYFTYNKVNEINALKIDVMIEDSPVTIPRFVAHTDILCFDARYNQTLSYPNLTRVYTWYDIYKEITRREVAKSDR